MNDVIVFPIFMQYFLELYGLCYARSCPINEARLSVSFHSYIAFDSGHSTGITWRWQHLHEHTKSKHKKNARIKKKHTDFSKLALNLTCILLGNSCFSACVCFSQFFSSSCISHFFLFHLRALFGFFGLLLEWWLQ